VASAPTQQGVIGIKRCGASDNRAVRPNLKLVTRLAAVAGVLAPLVLLVGCFPNRQMNDRLDAAIIDQLSLYQPNPTFIADVSQQLQAQGFTVDVYSGSQVTVDLYENLPAHGYEIIIFRAHAGFLSEDSGGEVKGPTYLFTGENYVVTCCQSAITGHF
jgi:hypothetical protein